MTASPSTWPGVVAVGWQRDREVEVDATADPPVPLHGPGQGDGSPEQRRSLAEVSGGDGRPDLGAPDGTPGERVRLHDHHVEAVAPAERGQRVGRSQALVAERRVRGHQEPAQGESPPDPLDEHVVGRLPQGGIERLDDRDLDTGLGQALETLGRIEQERRRMAGQHLVGVVVEGDDRRPGVTGRRLRHEMAEQVQMAEVEAVEDPDDHEGRAQLLPESLDPADDLHPRQPTGTAAGGATNTLSGASRPADPEAIATSEPSGATRR